MLSHYNLFRRQGIDHCCAVRQDRPVPAFVRGGEWEFDGSFWDNGSGTPPGFQPDQAREATQLAGFYFFERTGPASPAVAA